MGDVRGGEYGPFGVFHELERFLEDLMDPIFDVHCEVRGYLRGEGGDSDRLGDIPDGVSGPEGGHCCYGWFGRWEQESRDGG